MIPKDAPSCNISGSLGGRKEAIAHRAQNSPSLSDGGSCRRGPGWLRLLGLPLEALHTWNHDVFKDGLRLVL